MRLQRIICLVAIGLTLATVGGLAVPRTGEARPAPVAASINLGDLLGNENEPDENEADEGSRAQPAQSSGTSLPVVIALVALALIAGGYAAIRLRRLWLRVRGWGSDLRARL